MKKFFMIVMIGLGIWQYYAKQSVSVSPTPKTETAPASDNVVIQTLSKIKNMLIPESNFTCDGREYCYQMQSYEEAKYFIEHCPNTKMDGDHDGIPCESQFNK